MESNKSDSVNFLIPKPIGSIGREQCHGPHGYLGIQKVIEGVKVVNSSH